MLLERKQRLLTKKQRSDTGCTHKITSVSLWDGLGQDRHTNINNKHKYGYQKLRNNHI